MGSDARRIDSRPSRSWAKMSGGPTCHFRYFSISRRCSESYGWNWMSAYSSDRCKT